MQLLGGATRALGSDRTGQCPVGHTNAAGAGTSLTRVNRGAAEDQAARAAVAWWGAPALLLGGSPRCTATSFRSSPSLGRDSR